MFDIPQRFVITGLWTEPFFKTGPAWERMILGGWNISEITSFQSGQTLSLSASGNVTTAQGNITSNRPNVVPGVSDQLAHPTIAQWFNTAAFTPPAPFTFGNASRTIPNVMGPRLINTDFALYKDFRIREKYIIDLRGEAFNSCPCFRSYPTVAHITVMGPRTRGCDHPARGQNQE